MGFRVAYGNKYSENGWRMVDRDMCVVANVVPHSNTAPVRAGDAATILNAWLIYYHRHIEPITSPVWGWSRDNDVPNSNHLAGVALDIGAPKYPFRRKTMPAAIRAKVEEGLRLFEGTVGWGGHWTSPVDEMHYQLAYGEGDGRIWAFADKLNRGHLGLYGTPAPPNEGVFMALSHDEQVELLTKVRQLHDRLLDPKPSMVDGKPFAAAELIRTADYHACLARANTKVISEDVTALRGELAAVLAALGGTK